MADTTNQSTDGDEAATGDTASGGTDNAAKGIRVFVYGTLKQGHGNHGILAGANFLGRCAIEGKFRMVDLGFYPGLCRDESLASTSIFGEVYRVDAKTLDALDLLEGHPNFYTRHKVETGQWKGAWAYFLPKEYAEKAPGIDAGVWEPTAEEQEFVANGAA